MTSIAAESSGADATTVTVNNNNEEILELRRREEEAQREIAKLRRQLSEARRERTSAEEVSQPTPVEVAARDTEAVANALKYLDAVIQRVSSKSETRKSARDAALPCSRSTNGNENGEAKEASNICNDDAEPTPLLVRASPKKVVELEFCPTLITDDDDDSGLWKPAGAIKPLVDDMSSVGTSSLAAGDGGSASAQFGRRSALSSEYCTATGDASYISTSASSWQPTGAMAALVASMGDDSTINTLLTADDDDFEDMKTCVSALTHLLPSSGGSNTSKTTTATAKDDAALVLSQLHHIQSLLLAVLKDKEIATKDDTIGIDGKDRRVPSIEQMSSRAKVIASLWENQLNGEKCRPTATKGERDDDNMQNKASTRATLTKEDAEQIIASLAGIF